MRRCTPVNARASRLRTWRLRDTQAGLCRGRFAPDASPVISRGFPMTAPIISFCIPTFTRSRYLEALLGSLADHLAAFPYAFEIVIGDNASTDRTGAVVDAFRTRLPIRYFRHAENIGGFPNFQFVMSQALGRYVMYVADDDSILAVHVAAAVAKMEADPEIAVVYAPWMLFDLVHKKNLGLVFSVPHDLQIRRGRHRELLDHVLSHHIFPEIQIVRRAVLQRAMPRINPHAFFAFVHAADYLVQGDVLIQQQPFYASITQYFADEVRAQIGSEEAAYAWDRYRGGLEYLMARAQPQFAPQERLDLQARVEQMIAVRLSVAIRLRHAAGSNPIDTWMLAMRLRGMGCEPLSPVPLSVLASWAALYFLATDADLHHGAQKIICVGVFEPDLRAYLQRNSLLPLECTEDPPVLDALSATLVFTRGDLALPSSFDAVRQVRVLSESDLRARFAL